MGEEHRERLQGAGERGIQVREARVTCLQQGNAGREVDELIHRDRVLLCGEKRPKTEEQEKKKTRRAARRRQAGCIGFVHGLNPTMELPHASPDEGTFLKNAFWALAKARPTDALRGG